MKEIDLGRIEHRDVSNEADKVYVSTYAAPLSTLVNTKGSQYGAIVDRKITINSASFDDNLVNPTTIQQEKTSTKVSYIYKDKYNLKTQITLYVKCYQNNTPVVETYKKISDNDFLEKKIEGKPAAQEGLNQTNLVIYNTKHILDYSQTILQSNDPNTVLEYTRYSTMELGGVFYNNSNSMNIGLYPIVFSSVNAVVVKWKKNLSLFK